MTDDRDHRDDRDGVPTDERADVPAGNPAHGSAGERGQAATGEPADDRAARLDRLASAGFDLAGFTPEQRDVLLELGPDELAILLDIKHRLEDAGPDVRAHSEIAGGALF